MARIRKKEVSGKNGLQRGRKKGRRIMADPWGENGGRRKGAKYQIES